MSRIEDFRYRYAPWLLLIGVLLLSTGIAAGWWTLIIAGIAMLLVVILP